MPGPIPGGAVPSNPSGLLFLDGGSSSPLSGDAALPEENQIKLITQICLNITLVHHVYYITIIAIYVCKFFFLEIISHTLVIIYCITYYFKNSL